MTNSIQPTPDETIDNLQDILRIALEYLDGDELAAAADALLVKTWKIIERDRNRDRNRMADPPAAIVMDELTHALDLYIKSND